MRERERIFERDPQGRCDVSKLGDIYEKFPDNVFSDALKRFGSVMKAADKNEAGRWTNETIHRVAAKLIIGVYEIAGLDENRSAADVVGEFMGHFFSDVVDIEAVSEDEIVLTFSECPYGFRDEEHTGPCSAVKILEDALVDRLGGELVIEEHRLEGAGVCRLRVINS